MNSGGVFGALDPNSSAADKHAERYYAFVRSTSADVEKIAKNTGLQPQIIKTIKNYLFVEEHDVGGLVQRFDPNYDISQSWQRLWQGEPILPHDLTLLYHEAYEQALVQSGMSQGQAHIIASRKYNYAREVREYHAATDKH